MGDNDSVVRLFCVRGSHTYDYSQVRFMDRLRLALLVIRGGRFAVRVPTNIYGKASQVSVDGGAA